MLSRLDPWPPTPLLPHTPKSYEEKEWVHFNWVIGGGGLGLAAILFSPNREGRLNRVTHLHALGLAQSVIVNLYVTEFAKLSIGRKRPSYEAAKARDPGFTEREYRVSFWSGHASSTFNLATYVNLYLLNNVSTGRGWSWKGPLAAFNYGLASAVAYSRVLDHHHHVSDIVAGAVTGTAVSLLIYSWKEGRFFWQALPLGQTKNTADRIEIRPWGKGLELYLAF